MYQTPCVFNPSTITSVSFSEEDAPQFLKQCWGCIEHKLNKNYYALLHDASLLVAFPTMIATLKISIIGLLVTSLTPATIHNHCDSGDSLVVRTRLLSLSLLSLPASSMDSTGVSFHNSPIARSVWIKAALPINGTLKTPIASSRWLVMHTFSHHLSPDCCQITVPSGILSRTFHFGRCFQSDSMCALRAQMEANPCRISL